MKLYWNLFLMNLKSQMQYRMSFFDGARAVSDGLRVLFSAFAFIFERIDAVDGFTYGQVFLCFAVVVSAFSVGELFGGGGRRVFAHFGDGSFDRALVRPRPVLLQILCRILILRGSACWCRRPSCCAGRCRRAASRGQPKALALVLMIVCGAVVFFAMFLLKAACTFFTTESVQFLDIFTYGARVRPLPVFGLRKTGAVGSDLRRAACLVPVLPAFVSRGPLVRRGADAAAARGRAGARPVPAALSLRREKVQVNGVVKTARAVFMACVRFSARCNTAPARSTVRRTCRRRRARAFRACRAEMMLPRSNTAMLSQKRQEESRWLM